MSDYQIDNVDRGILNLLLQNATMPYTEIAEHVHVSAGTVHVRMRKLEHLGIVRGAQLQIDYTKLGYDITAFIGVYLKESSMYDEVVAQLKLIPEILTMNYTTGNYSIFAKIICRDTQHLMHLLHDKIQKVNGIERTETFISLHESVQRPLMLSNT